MDAFDKENEEYEQVYKAFSLMALCNSVFPIEKDGKKEYFGSSPDDITLVKAAASVKIVLSEKNDANIYLSINNNDEVFEILAEIPFTSERRRMSVVIKNQKQQIFLLAKGADSIM